jgi:glycosyltransferase involved in cell wall biosynthesis
VSTPELYAYTKAHGLEGQVVFTGFRNDVPGLLKASDVFALTSEYEGTAGALIEAQAAGLPIITNDLEAIEEIVQRDVNAVFIHHNDVEELAAAILVFYKDKEQLKRFGAASVSHFMKKFSLEQSNRSMIQLYHSLAT